MALPRIACAGTLAVGLMAWPSSVAQEADAPRADWPGRYAQRGPGRELRLGDPTQQAVRDALRWLVHHQEPGGHWDADGFMEHDPVDDRCDGAGSADRDVEVTALALLAFLGNGDTALFGDWKPSVARASEWLLGQQDSERGTLGTPRAHAIATQALCELAALDREPRIEAAALSAIHALLGMRQEYGSWREDEGVPSVDDVTLNAWALAALRAAEVAKLAVALESSSIAWLGAKNWVNEITDPGTGFVNPLALGSSPARGAARDVVAEVDEADRRRALATATAAALYLRIESGEAPRRSLAVKGHDLAILGTVRDRDPWSLDTLEPEGWYLASQAYTWLGGERWQSWHPGMWRAVIDAQRRDGAAQGSWDPRSTDGAARTPAGIGRVGCTALFVLALESHFRDVR